MFDKLKGLFTGKKHLHTGKDIDMDGISANSIYNVTMPDFAAFWGEYTDSNLCNLYHSIGEIYTPIHIVSERVAGAKWGVYKLSDDSEVLGNKYMDKLLSKPNPLQNWHEFIYQEEAYYMATGKSFIYANCPTAYNINYRNIATLINLQADTVQIRLQPILKYLSATTIDELILDYVAPSGMQEQMFIPTANVMYSKFPSLYGTDLNIRGRSPMLSAQKAVANLIAVYSARNVIYTKRGALGYLVSKKTDAAGNIPLTPSEHKETLVQINKEYGLSKGKSPIGLVDQPVEFINIGMSIKDLEPFTETEHDAAVIFAVYGVPRELMPRKEGAKFENQNHAEKSVYENVVIPRANSLAQSLTSFLKLDEAGMYLKPTFDHVAVLQENLKEKSEVESKNGDTYEKRLFNGIITLNDWRVCVGLEPVVNKFYDRLIYDMSPDEIKQVETIVNLSKGKTNANQATQQGTDTATQQNTN